MPDPSYIDATGVLTDGEAWIPISTTGVVGSSGTHFATFTSGTGTANWSQYIDMFIVAYIRTDESANASYTRIYFDEDINSAVNDNWGMWTNGSSLSSGISSTNGAMCGYCAAGNAPSNVFSCQIIYLANVNSGNQKSLISNHATQLGSTYGYVGMDASTYQPLVPNTGIETIEFGTYYSSSTKFVEGSRIDLFGVLPRMVS